MSYQRSPYPLRYFRGTTTEYVWSEGERITDYGSSYKHDPSFCELIRDIVERETGDEEYANKIMMTLANKIGCSGELRASVAKQWASGKRPRCFGKWDTVESNIYGTNKCNHCLYTSRCIRTTQD